MAKASLRQTSSPRIPKAHHPSPSGHLDTVSATGWDTDPFRTTIEQDRLTGLGAADMKGPIAAFLSAARQMDSRVRPKIVLTADEEVTKQGVREVVAKSRLLRDVPSLGTRPQ